jgi:lipopolysaccharide biosynthesis glycosyltransferase
MSGAVTKHVAFTSSAEFLPWCSVAMRSCLDNLSGGVVVHLLHNGALDDHPGIPPLEAMVVAAGGRLQVHGIDKGTLGSLPLTEQYGTVVFLYYLLPQLLPDVERVLYIDADTLTVSSLDELFATDLEGAPFGAIANIVPPAERPRIEALGIKDHRRFLNSGVLLLDLDRFRAEDATETLFRTARERAHEITYADQDTLNLVFDGRWRALHPRWNAQYTLWTAPDTAAEVFGRDQAEEARTSPAVVHFEGPGVCKPWHALNAHPLRRMWWDTLALTPWAGTPAEDRGAATTALRYLPEWARLRAYWRLLRWRERRSQSA